MICSVCSNHNLVLSSFITYRWICNKSNTTDAINRAGTSYPSGALDLVPVLCAVCVAQCSVFCVVFYISSFVLCFFSLSPFWCLSFFDWQHLWLPFKYLQEMCEDTNFRSYNSLIHWIIEDTSLMLQLSITSKNGKHYDYSNLGI